MRRTLAVLLGVLASAGAFADEWLWMRGSDPDWTSSTAPYANVSGNWSNLTTGATTGYPNAATDIAVFRGDARLRCANDRGNQKFGGIRVEGGTVEFLSVYDTSRAIQFAAPTNTIFVDEGASLVLTKGPSIGGIEDDAQVVVLSGAGQFSWSGKSWLGDRADGGCRLKDFIVRDFNGGTFNIPTTVGDNSIRVFHLASGMTARWASGVNNKVGDYSIVRLDANSTFDMNGGLDTLGAFVGDGVVTNCSQAKVRLPGGSGPFPFGGRFYGKMMAEGTTSFGADSYVLLTSPDAFAGTWFVFGAYNGGALLRFAPGVGTFSIGSFTPAAGQKLVLEDTDGNPVAVRTPLATTGSESVVGSGDFIYNGTAEVTYSKTAVNNTGWISVESGKVVLGDGTAENDPPLAQYAGFESRSPGALRFSNSAAVKIDGEIAGDGTVDANGPAEWTAFRMTGGVLNDYSSLVLTNSHARLSQLSVWADSSLVVSGGEIAGAGTGDDAFFALTGGSGTSAVIENGAMVKAAQVSVRSVTVRGDSTLNINGGLANCGTAEEPQVIRLDGATVSFGSGADMSVDTQFGTMDTSAVHRRVYVKEGGVTVISTPEHALYGYGIGQFDSETEAGAVDGGVTLSGPGLLRLDGQMNITGPLRFIGGNSQVRIGSTFGTLHDVELGSSRLEHTKAMAVHFASGSSARAVLSGAMTISIKDGSSYAFGAASAAADSVFDRRRGGVLFFESVNPNPSVTVNGGVSDTSAGVSSLPVFTFTQERGDSGDQSGRWHLQFVKFVNGALSEVYGTAWNSGLTASDIALVDSSGGANVTANMSVGGIRLFGCNGTALTVGNGVTLSVGDGVSPAAILMNNTHASGRGKARIGGSGTIDFGASEGIVAVNLIQSGMLESEFNCRIAGTSGVTFASPGESVWLALGAANTYTGGTSVENICIDAKSAGCFSSGDVFVAPGQFAGGEVRFETPATYANNFRIGGWGARTASRRHSEGAFWFVASPVTISGAVTLLGDTRIGATAAGQGVLNAPVSGVGPLDVRGDGTIVFGAANTFVGGLKIGSGATVEVREGGTPGAEAVVVDGILRFQNSSDVVVANEVSGFGRIELCGSGSVTFSDGSGFTGTMVTKNGSGEIDVVVGPDGVFDMAGNDQTFSSLVCQGTVTNSAVSRVVMTLAGDSSVAAGASFGAPNLDIVLLDGVTLDLGGGTFTIRRLTGDRRNVVNGTLVELKPALGHLLILK